MMKRSVVKTKQENDGKKSNFKDTMVNKRRKKFCGRPKKLLIYSIFLFISSLVLYHQIYWPSHQTNYFDFLAHNFGFQIDQYAVIIDAGSTGSRVNVFEFRKSLYSGNVKIERQLFLQVKPGLSSFADNPQNGAKTISELIVHAKNFIPEIKWKSTPIALRATAGLRLLDSDKSTALLKEVTVAVSDSPFLSTENSVSIMDGKDEGLFSWFTVNFLMDRLGGSLENTVGALDLGGGSTQITFAPIDDSRIKNDSPQFLYTTELMQSKFNIYTKSYLGLGLMAARKEILTYDSKPGSVNIFSKCVNPIIKDKKWSYGGVEYSISGNYNSKAVVNFTECRTIVKNIINTYNVDNPKELFQHDIVAFSYYFDRATEIGLVDPMKGGTILLFDFIKSAFTECGNANAEQPFMCLDLIFISVLLQEGFGLLPSRPIQLISSIDNYEISWALGAAVSILNTGL